MLFWKSNSSSSGGGGSAGRKPPPAADPPPPPATNTQYALTDQRRRELLLAARASRVSWIDGSAGASVDNRDLGTLALPRGSRAGSSVPPQCQQALEAVVADLQAMFSSLEELKRLIIPNPLLASDERGERESAAADGDRDDTSPRYRTVFQDLHEHDALLATWLRTQGHALASPVRRQQLTSSDRELVFLLAFRELIAVLKNPRAAELVYQIQSFVKRFETAWDLPAMLQQRAPQNRPGGRVNAFVAKLVQQLRHNDKLLEYMNAAADSADSAAPVSELLGGSDDWSAELLHEVLEAFVLEKVYAKALTPSPEAEREDCALHARLQALAFVDFRHLDLPAPPTDELAHAWRRLVRELQQLPRFMAPRRKVDCVLRVCEGLTALLARQRRDGRPPSADEFLPGLIYVLLQANPRELKRSLRFVREYRSPRQLQSEPGYFFTHLESSVVFLEGVTGAQLTISPDEFEDGLRRSKQQLVARAAATVSDTTTTATTTAGDRPDDLTTLMRDDAPSVLEVRARRLATLARLA
ncbi:hypothetical protein PybrP1_000511 [[Pythium] brassicae (nom. inval.)]|nr:hypothetical protein PybrP1_000511 [[Pythium] brassicae (nom. inval.)]